MKSNLIPITRIYDIYPKYTYSNDVKKFMDEIIDIDRANVFTKSDMVDIFDKIKAEIEQRCCITVGRENDPAITLYDVFQIIDKYKIEGSDK